MITDTTYDDLTIGELLRQIKEQRIALPRYQRDVVWPLEKKRKLIDAVRNGFPVGSLLLAEVDQVIDGISHKAWRIIDGLQRTSTFQAYDSEPELFIEKGWVKPEWLELASAIVLTAAEIDIDSDSLKQALLEFMLQPKNNRDRLKLYDRLACCADVGIDKFTSIMDVLDEQSTLLITQIASSLDVSDRRIPVIKFVGSPEDQASAFAGLNTGSVQLNKYEIAASIWRKPCNVSNPDVLVQIRKYWKERLDNLQMEIDGISEDGTPHTYMLFDVLVGLGRHLCSSYPLLFKMEWGDTIGFQIAAISHQLRLSSINAIEDCFEVSGDGLSLKVDDFIKAAESACKHLNKALKPVLGLKLTARTVKSQFQDHSALHICSLIVSIMTEACMANGQWAASIADRTPDENMALSNWYLIDRLRGEWGNAGDSTLFNRVWKELEVNGSPKIVSNPVYRTSPDKQTAQLALDNWFQEEITKTHREREIISPETKLVLRYFYSQRITHFDNHAGTFHIDHLIPIDFWKRLFAEARIDGLPINGIGNLCLMNTEDHSTKGVKLPLSWHQTDVVTFPVIRQQRCKEHYFLVAVDSFAFAESARGLLETGGMDEAAGNVVRRDFLELSRIRWKSIRDAIVNSYFPT